MSNEVVMVKNGVYQNTGVARLDNSVSELANLLISSRKSDTAIAKQCLEIRDSYKEDASPYKTWKFEKVIDTLFGNSMAGQTAYKFAQCAELFEGIPDVWDFYTMSRMQILTRVLSKKMTEKGASLADFWYYVGSCDNARIAENYQKWHDENASIIESIQFNRDNGHEDVAIMLENTLKAKGVEPTKPIEHNSNDEEYNEKLREYGYNLTLYTTDSNFKKMISAYIKYIQNDRNEPTEEPTEGTTEGTTETTEETTEAEKTLAELKADCITTLTAFIEKFGEKPQTLDRALSWFDKQKFE